MLRLAWPLASRCPPGHRITPDAPLGAEAGPPKRGGILRVRGYDPVHFDPHQTTNFKTHTTLSLSTVGWCGIRLVQRFSRALYC